MPKKDKLGILDLETLDATWSKSAEVGMLQWILKLINAEKFKKLTSGLANLDKGESDREEKELYEQYKSFGSALRLNDDDDYTLDDVEQTMRHFILAHDKSFNAKGIKSLDRGKYEIDDAVAYYIKESFLRYLDSPQKKGDLDKAFKAVKKGGVKKPFPSAMQGYVPEVIQNIMNEFLDIEGKREGKVPLNITNIIESYSTSEDIKLSTLKDWWKEYHRNALVTFEIKLAVQDLDFTETQVEQIREHFIKDFRK